MRSCAAVVTLWALTASADEAHTEMARQRFQRGSELYEQGQYVEAIEEFRRAAELHPAPAFEFNIGRCWERLGNRREAAAAYRRYLTSKPDAPERAELTARMALWEPPPPPPVKAKPIYKRWWLWTAVGGVVVVGVGVGLGVGLSRPTTPSAQTDFGIHRF